METEYFSQIMYEDDIQLIGRKAPVRMFEDCYFVMGDYDEGIRKEIGVYCYGGSLKGERDVYTFRLTIPQERVFEMLGENEGREFLEDLKKLSAGHENEGSLGS